MLKLPRAEFQVEFLERVQRILTEGVFTATYKFALLHALADLSVERVSSDPGGPLTVTIDSITERFVDLYYRQARLYPGRRGEKILLQNSGKQAAVVNALSEPAREYRVAIDPGELPGRAIRKIDETIRKMPLWKLQRLAGGECLDFLYENSDDATARKITLRPGIAHCFRMFHPFIVSMVRERWEKWIRRQNADVLDEAVELHEFLFGSERQNLLKFREVLIPIHGKTCFYKDTRLVSAFDVDHFIPWSRYPVDLGHNLVLASRDANQKKKDLVPGLRYLDRWLGLCVKHHPELSMKFDEGGLRHDLCASLAIAEWTYEGVAKSGGTVWNGDREPGPLDAGWRDLFDQARRDLNCP